MKRKGTIREAS